MALITILIIEIPFLFVQNFIARRPVINSWPNEKM
jgi:hypothetical protein